MRASRSRNLLCIRHQCCRPLGVAQLGPTPGRIAVSRPDPPADLVEAAVAERLGMAFNEAVQLRRHLLPFAKLEGRPALLDGLTKQRGLVRTSILLPMTD